MKSKIKKILASLSVSVLIATMMMPNVTNAAYQSRPNFTALRNKTITTFFEEVRKMEAEGGTLGLKGMNANDNDAIYKGYDNGIDVHVIKNSEWGAAVMLALSGYGVGSSAQTATYSTGNYSGINNLGTDNYWEYTMTMVSTEDGLTKEQAASNNAYQYIDGTSAYANGFKSKSIARRYYDLYYVKGITGNSQQTNFYSLNYGSSAVIDHYGDLYYETNDFFKDQLNAWYYNVYPGYQFYSRGNSSYGAVFGSNDRIGDASTYFGTRAVVVCGAGL